MFIDVKNIQWKAVGKVKKRALTGPPFL